MRIIDADALKEAINNLYEYAELDDVIQTIDNAPTVESRPQGYWIEGTLGYYCSECESYDRFYFEHSFCPCCGADMRKEVNDESVESGEIRNGEV